MENLLFAQKFPFSERARNYLKELDITPEKVPEQVLKRAALMVSKAYSGNEYLFDASNPSEEMLKNEVMAFPIAKMFVSLLSAPNSNEKFAHLIRKSTFNYLINSKNAKESSLELLYDFGLTAEVTEQKDFFVEMNFLDYLGIYFVDPESKLVNRRVDKGKVFLTLNDFVRFLSEKAYKRVIDSLPIKKDFIPKEFVPLAKSIEGQLVVIEKKNFDLKLLGKVDPNLFPPCMKVLYADMLAAKKLSYLARLALSSFLFQIGMSKTELMNLLSKSPDFKKNIAEYHINRIFDKKLSAPGCKKMQDYGLRVAECQKECRGTHPMRYYLRQLRTKNRSKSASSSNEQVEVK